MYALIDDRDVGEVHDNVRVVIGEGSGEVSIFVSRLSVTIQSHAGEQRIEIPIPPDDVGEAETEACPEHGRASDPTCEACTAESDARDATRMSGDRPACHDCGHQCPNDATCPKCSGDPMEPGDTLCVDCDARAVRMRGEASVMLDPGDMAYDDLVEVVRTIQATLFPNGEQIEWGSGTLGAVGGIFDDAGLSPREDAEESEVES